MPNGRTVLLFTRAPEAEARAKRLPVAEGARLFAGFLSGWEQRSREVGADLLVITPSACQSAVARLLPGASIAVQSGNSFGDRIESAFDLAFQRGSHSVLMVGGDGPPISASDLEAAFAHLDTHPRGLVLTPAEDGGVNAIGFAALADRALAGVAWCSGNVCAQLIAEGLRSGLPVLLTAHAHDLDSAANVCALYRLSRSQPGWSAYRWLLLAVLHVSHSVARAGRRAFNRLAEGSLVTRGPPVSLFA